MTIISTYKTKVEGYLAGLDFHNPLPSDDLSEKGKATARALEKSLEDVARYRGTSQRIRHIRN